MESISVEAMLKAVDAGFSRTMRNAEKAVGSFSTTVGEKMAKTSKALSVGITAPLTVITGKAIKTGAEFDKQMSRVGAIAGATGEDLNTLRKQALKMGQTTVFSAKESAEGMENLASAGFETKDIIQAIPSVLDLAAVSGNDVALASEAAGSAIRQFGLDVSKTGHIADVFAKTAAATNAEVVDTAEALKYAGPIAGSLGIKIEELSASIGIMANSGIKGSQAGTTLRSALTRLASPTAKAKQTMQELNLEFFDSQGKMKPLSSIVNQLQTSFRGLTDEQKQQALTSLFGQQAMSGMLALVNSTPGELEKMTQGLVNSDGEARKMADTMNQGLPGAITRFNDALETAQIALTDVLGETIENILTKLTDLLNAFTNAEPSTQKMIIGFGAIAGSAGPLLAIFSKILLSTEGITKAFVTLGGASKGTTKVFKATGGSAGTAGGSLALMGSQAIGTTGAVSAMGSSSVMAGGSLGFMGTQATVASGAVATTAVQAGFLTKTLRALSVVLPIVSGLSLALAGLGVVVAGVGIVGAKFSDEILSGLSRMETEGPVIIKRFADKMTQKASEIAHLGMLIISKFIEAIAVNLPTIFESGTNILITFMKGMGERMPDLLHSVALMLGNLLIGIAKNLPRFVTAGMELLAKLALGIKENLPLLIEKAAYAMTTFLGEITKNLPKIVVIGAKIIWNLAVGIIKSLPKLFKGLWNGWKEQMGQFWGSVIEQLSGLLGEMFNWLKGWAEKLNPFNWFKKKHKENADALRQGMDDHKQIVDTKSKEAGNRLISNTTESSNKATNQWQQHNTAVGSLFDEQNATIDQKTKQGGIQANANIAGSVGDIEAKIGQSNANIGGILDQTNANVKGKMDTMSGIFSQGGQDITNITSENYANLNEKTVQNVQGFLNQITQAFDSAKTTITQNLQAIDQAITQSGKAMAQSLSAVFNQIKQATVQGGQQVIATFIAFTTRINQVFAKGLAKLPQQTTKIAPLLNNAFSGMLNGTLKTITSNLNAIGQTFTTKLQGIVAIVKANISAVKQAFAQGLVNVSSNVKTALNGVVGAYKQNLAKVHATVVQGMANIKQSIATTNNQMTANIKQTLSNIAQMTAQQLTTIRQRYTQTFNTIYRTVNTQMNGIRNSIQSNLNQIVGIFNRLSSHTEQAGRYAMIGFNNGMVSESNHVMNTAQKIANNVAKTIKKALDIHSPSKVTKELGQYVGEGLALGISNSTAGVNKQTKRLANNVVDQLNVATDQLNHGLTFDLGQMATQADVNVTNNPSQLDNGLTQQPLNIDLDLSIGGYTFRTFVEAITNQQNKDNELYYNY